MANSKRNCSADEVFYVLNRAVAKLTIFKEPEDYAVFMSAVAETWQILPLSIYAIGGNAESLKFCCPA